jgi:hypothetical protein
VRHLLFPDAPEREHASLAEELLHTQLAELTPVRVVGGADDVLAAMPPQLMVSRMTPRWRSQKARSWVFITSQAASAEETTSVGTEPKRSIMTGP